MTTRREWLQTMTGAVAGFAAGARLVAADDNDLEVWKSPTCGCCLQWVNHMRTNGFRPNVHDVADVAPFRRKYGVPQALESCHTAVVGGFALEGHVPADLVRRMLKERPAIAGLAVPGMPMGSPGMEQGGQKDKFNVIAFDKQGKTTIYASR